MTKAIVFHPTLVQKISDKEFYINSLSPDGRASLAKMTTNVDMQFLLIESNYKQLMLNVNINVIVLKSIFDKLYIKYIENEHSRSHIRDIIREFATNSSKHWEQDIVLSFICKLLAKNLNDKTIEHIISSLCHNNNLSESIAYKIADSDINLSKYLQFAKNLNKELVFSLIHKFKSHNCKIYIQNIIMNNPLHELDLPRYRKLIESFA